MKILLIRFSSIGDIVLTTPIIRCLKQQVPDAEIHYLTKKSFAGILQHNPYIDRLHLLDHSWEIVLHELKDHSFDYIIDLHHNLRSLRVKRAFKGTPAFSFDKLNVKKWLLTALKVNRLPNVHIVDRCFDTVKSLGVVNDGKGLDYFIPTSDEVQPKDIPAAHSFGYVGVVIGAALATKQMPIAKLQELCSKIAYPIILLGGKEDVTAGEAIASIDPIRIYNACGKFNLNESADLVRKAKLIITHDTGLMHIAAALHKPIISIWGNTVPAFGMTPYYGDHPVANQAFEVSNISCRPCSKIGHKKCPRGHFKCMQLQDTSLIAATAMRWVQ